MDAKSSEEHTFDSERRRQQGAARAGERRRHGPGVAIQEQTWIGDECEGQQKGGGGEAHRRESNSVGMAARNRDHREDRHRDRGLHGREHCKVEDEQVRRQQGDPDVRHRGRQQHGAQDVGAGGRHPIPNTRHINATATSVGKKSPPVLQTRRPATFPERPVIVMLPMINPAEAHAEMTGTSRRSVSSRLPRSSPSLNMPAGPITQQRMAATVPAARRYEKELQPLVEELGLA